MDYPQRATALRIRIFYWFTFVALGASVSFFSYYYNRILVYSNGKTAIGLIGIIFFLQFLLGAFANPIAGYIADKFKIENRVLSFCGFVVVVGGFLIGIPVFNLFPELSLGNKVLIISTGVMVTGIFFSPILPLINTETIEHLHKTKISPGGWGLFRITGTISWVITTVILGLILDYTGNLAFIPITYCAGTIILAFFALSGIKARVKRVKIPWAHLIKNKPFLRFLVFAFIQAFALYSVMIYTGLFFDNLKMSPFMIGLAFSLSAVLEIPVMFLAQPITRRIGSRAMVIIGTSILALKLYLLAILAPFMLHWLLIAVMILNGLGFGLQVNGIINLIDRWAHKDMRATYMSIYAMIGVYIAMACGNLFSSFILKVLGDIWMMLINAIIVTVGIFYFIIFVKD